MQDVYKEPQYGFTDREEYIEAFWKNYNKVKKNGLTDEPKGPCVLNYYGFEGIGKTALLKTLMQEMKIREKRFVYLDFKKEIPCERSSVLNSLKILLEDKYKFNFTLFPLAMYVYRRKIGRPYSESEIKTLIESTPFLKAVVDLIGEIPIFKMTAKIFTVIDQVTADVRKWIERHKRTLYEIEGEDDDTGEIAYKNVSYAFAKDIAENIESYEEPFVFLFDGYENIISQLNSTPLEEDEWIRGGRGYKKKNSLIQNIPNALWVIVGNEKLRWIESDPFWDGKLEQHLLRSLSKKDTFDFLLKNTVVDPNLYDKLYTLTNGTPIALTLCVDRCAEIIDRGEKPAIEDFGNTIDTLIEKFVGGIVDGKKDILYMLSCIHRWDNELIKETAEKILSSFSPSAFDTVQKLSFISVDSGIYTMHPTVRNVLYKNCDKKFSVIKEKTEKILTEYYQRKLIGRDEFSPGFENDLFLYARYATAQGTEDIAALYVEKFLKYSERLVNCAKLSTATELVELFWHNVESFPDSENKMSLASDYASVLVSKGQYKKAGRLFEFVNNWNIEFLGEKNPKTLESMNNLAENYSNLGKFEIAIKLQKEVVEKSREILDEDHRDTIFYMNNLAINYLRNGNFKEAIELQEKVVVKSREILDEDDPDRLIAMNDFAAICSEFGYYDYALKLQKEVVEKTLKNLPENHPETIRAMNNLGRYYADFGDYDNAIKLQEKVLAKSLEIFGEEHHDTLTAMNNLAYNYLNLKRYDEAVKLLEVVVAKRRDNLTEEHPDTLKSMNNLSRYYFHLKRYDEALQLSEIVVEKNRKILGENHPETLKTMNILAEQYFHKGLYEKAIELQTEVVEKSRKFLPKNHPSIKQYMKTLKYFKQTPHPFMNKVKPQKKMVGKKWKTPGEEFTEMITQINSHGNSCPHLDRQNDSSSMKASSYIEKDVGDTTEEIDIKRRQFRNIMLSGK